MCRNCSGFQEFYHTSQLFILLSSGQTFTYPSDCFFFFFWMCGNDQNRFQQNVFKPNFGRGARIFISKWTRHASEKCYCVLGHESHSNTVRLGMFLSFPIYSNLRAKRCCNYFSPLGKVFDWFLVLELEVNYSAYHEHVCIFAYIHM